MRHFDFLKSELRFEWHRDLNVFSNIGNQNNFSKQPSKAENPLAKGHSSNGNRL